MTPQTRDQALARRKDLLAIIVLMSSVFIYRYIIPSSIFSSNPSPALPWKSVWKNHGIVTDNALLSALRMYGTVISEKTPVHFDPILITVFAYTCHQNKHPTELVFSYESDIQKNIIENNVNRLGKTYYGVYTTTTVIENEPVFPTNLKDDEWHMFNHNPATRTPIMTMRAAITGTVRIRFYPVEKA
jgi:hypothetical protein